MIDASTVEATREGFRHSASESIHLDSGQSRAANVVLAIGQTTDSITVTGAVGLVETLGATLKEVVDEERIVDLPLSGRIRLQFARAGSLERPVHAGDAALFSAVGFKYP